VGREESGTRQDDVFKQSFENPAALGGEKGVGEKYTYGVGPKGISKGQERKMEVPGMQDCGNLKGPNELQRAAGGANTTVVTDRRVVTRSWAERLYWGQD